jgi:hypothetical protein
MFAQVHLTHLYKTSVQKACVPTLLMLAKQCVAYVPYHFPCVYVRLGLTRLYREGGPKVWSTLLVTALGSWEIRSSAAISTQGVE